jgi:hypothetical protein
MAICKKLPVFVYQERIDPEYKQNYLFFHKRFLSYTRNVCLKLPHLTFNNYFFVKTVITVHELYFRKEDLFLPSNSIETTLCPMDYQENAWILGNRVPALVTVCVRVGWALSTLNLQKSSSRDPVAMEETCTKSISYAFRTCTAVNRVRTLQFCM